MQIVTTRHFRERVEERAEVRSFGKRDLNYYVSSFESIIKLVKKNKIKVEQGDKPNTFVVRWGELKYVYSKNNGDYIILTFGIRDFKN